MPVDVEVNIGSGLPAFNIVGLPGAAVQEASLSRQRVLLPLPLHVNQRPLPAAEDEVLDARERQQLVGAVFGVHSFSISLTPAGTPALSTSTL